MARRILIGVGAALAVSVFPAAAWGSISPTIALNQSGGTGAGSTVQLGMNINFGPSGSDSPKDLTISLPPGLLSNAAIDGGACLHASASMAACQVGSGTVTASELGVPLSLPVKFYLVAPPKPGDLAGLALVTNFAGSSTQLGSPGEIKLRSINDPAGFGVNIIDTNIPNSFKGFPISVQSLNNTLTGVRLPTHCPSTPARVSLVTDSYSDPTPKAASAPLHVTGCSSLPFSPAFRVTAVKDPGDNGGKITTEITQTASPAQATPSAVKLKLPSTLAPNAGAVGNLCSNLASGTCTPIGSATSTSPLYPTPLTGTAYLVGSLSKISVVLVFPPPFALTLSGAVNLGANTTTFSGLPDIPQTDLKVTLFGGKNAVFLASCAPPAGVASATLTTQDADRQVVASAPFTTVGCPPSSGGHRPGGGPGPQGSHHSQPGRIRSASLSGLAAGRPVLRFKLVSGSRFRSFAVLLPQGLNFVTHRVRGRYVIIGVTAPGVGIRSLKLQGARLLITLRRAVKSVSIKMGTQALVETAALKAKARHHHARRLKLTVIIRSVSISRLLGP